MKLNVSLLGIFTTEGSHVQTNISLLYPLIICVEVQFIFLHILNYQLFTRQQGKVEQWTRTVKTAIHNALCSCYCRKSVTPWYMGVLPFRNYSLGLASFNQWHWHLNLHSTESELVLFRILEGTWLTQTMIFFFFYDKQGCIWSSAREGQSIAWAAPK